VTVETITPPRARVWFDTNAGAWCSQLPGRLPVQAESWADALDAIREHQLGPAGIDEAVAGVRAVARPRRRWWHQ
jgi:hypothetical protein